MDLTQGTQQEKEERAKKMMLWFGIVSLIMSFAGLTSAFIVSSSREDWLTDFKLPEAFWVSTIVIVISSVTLFFAKKAIKSNNRPVSLAFLIITFILGIVFIMNQFIGFNQILDSGYNFTGPTHNITMTYIYIIAAVHIAHVIAGLICLLFVIYGHLKQKYNANNMHGFIQASTFWHFVDILWLYLFFFLYFFNK